MRAEQSPPRTPPAAQTEDAGGVEGSDMGRKKKKKRKRRRIGKKGEKTHP